MLESLRRVLGFLERLRGKKPSQDDVERTYLGTHKSGTTTVEKMIQIINNFRKMEKRDVRGYLCVFDELYPDIEEILLEAIDRYEPPDNFKVIATYFDVSQALQDTLEELAREPTIK